MEVIKSREHIDNTTHIPLYVEIDASEKCNLDCVFCPRDARFEEGFFTPSVFEDTVAKYKEYKEELPADHILSGTNFPMFILQEVVSRC